jgi:TonB family protein
MKLMFLYLLLFLLTACTFFKTAETDNTEPKLLKQSPLPEIPESIRTLNFQFYCEMIVDESGNVENARLLESSGDKGWDSLAVVSLYGWKFSPAHINGKPIKTIVRRKVNVLFVDAKSITLSEIICKNNSDADKVYNRLISGESFEELARSYSISKSRFIGGYLGSVDIQHYTNDIRNALSKLKVNQITKPLEYGDAFAIFKRLKDL